MDAVIEAAQHALFVTLGSEDAGTRVHVAYDLTALGPEGEAVVESMDEAGFAAMLQEWENLIGKALARGD